MLTALWNDASLRAALANAASPQVNSVNSQNAVHVLQSLNAPIGWAGNDTVPHSFRPSIHVLRVHGVGWILTGFAISLGAPFWFNLLNKFVVVRCTVKPQEKSAAEASKD